MFVWKFFQITLNHSFTNLFVKEIKIRMELHIIEVYAQTFGAMTLSITTFSIKILSIKTCSTLDLIVKLSINDIDHNDIQHKHYMSSGWVSHFSFFIYSVSLCCVSWSSKFFFGYLNVVENKYLKNMEIIFEVNSFVVSQEQNGKFL